MPLWWWGERSNFTLPTQPSVVPWPNFSLTNGEPCGIFFGIKTSFYCVLFAMEGRIHAPRTHAQVLANDFQMTFFPVLPGMLSDGKFIKRVGSFSDVIQIMNWADAKKWVRLTWCAYILHKLEQEIFVTQFAQFSAPGKGRGGCNAIYWVSRASDGTG